MTVCEFVKPERDANGDRDGYYSDYSDERRETFGFLGKEENHVSAYRQLRDLERHRNDDAKHDAGDKNRRPDFAQARWRQFAFEPADPIGIDRSRFDKRHAHELFRRRTFDDRNGRGAHAE